MQQMQYIWVQWPHKVHRKGLDEERKSDNKWGVSMFQDRHWGRRYCSAASLYTQDRYDPLSPSSRPLYSPNNVPPDTIGQVDAVIERGDRKIEESVFVVRDLATSLLGFPAILRLNMIPHLNIIEDAVFLGLGQLKGDYKIKLKGSAQPFALSVPRRVALPLRSKVKQELDRMEEMGVIHSPCRGTYLLVCRYGSSC